MRTRVSLRRALATLSRRRDELPQKELLPWSRTFASAGGSNSKGSNAPANFPSTLPPVTPSPPQQEQKLTFRQLVSKYGPFIVVSYTGVWIASGVACYSILNFIGPDAALQQLKAYGADQYVDLSRIDPKVGNAGVGFVINELLEPIRLPLYLTVLRPACRWYDRRLKATSSTPSTPGRMSFTQLFSTYGGFGIIFYTSVWISTGLGMYATVNMLGPEFAIDTVRYFGLDQYVDLSRLDPRTGNLAIAIVMNELLEPLRFPLVVATLVPAKRAYDRLVK